MSELDPLRKLAMGSLLFIGILMFGVIGYMFLEDYSFLNALWLTITTVSTVGYGNQLPATVEGQVFTLVLIVLGVGLVAYTFSSTVGAVVEGQIINTFGRKKMNKDILKLKDHIIVCGAGRVGQQVIERLEKENVPFVVIDNDPECVSELLDNRSLVIDGDATEDKVLLRAGIERAKGLVSAVSGDSENVFVTLTSRGLNPNLTIVARANMLETEAKLKRAGADKVITPSAIGGRRMAISILKPISVDFVETLITNKRGLEIEIEEVTIGENSSLCEKTLMSSGIKSQTGAMVVAVQRKNNIISNPDAKQDLHAGDILIVIGTRSQLKALEGLAQGEK